MKIVCLYSGGLDSTTLLWHLRDQGHEVLPISINYNQRHKVELAVADHASKLFGGTEQVDLQNLRSIMKGSSQTDDNVPVPAGHYADENMKLTVVPNRNMLLLAVAGAYAISQKADAIAFANHAGDHTIYPDCRQSFVQAMELAFQLCDWHMLTLLAPFTSWSKTKVAAEAGRLGVPIGDTWSCYDPQRVPPNQLNNPTIRPWVVNNLGYQHCGVCGTCTERIEAIQGAGLADPTWYASYPG